MLLDNYKDFRDVDPQNMLGEIDHLPDQLATAWALGQTYPLPAIETIEKVTIAGMGNAAFGADLLAAYATPICAVPVSIHRDYDLPAFARGSETLFIAVSHSGNTEETITALDAAIDAGCTIVVVSTGGELAKRATALNVPFWKFEHAGPPHAGVGHSFGLLLALFARLGLIPPEQADIPQTVADMKSQQRHLRADVLAEKNPAKRTAGQAAGRWVTVFGANYLAPVARRWKAQINQIAKTGSNFEYLPEADHHTLAGTLNPEKVLLHTHNIFLRAKSDHPRNRLRSDMTRKAFMLEALSTDTVDARGKTPLSHMWTTLHFGDYVSYYLAMIYGVDPTPIDALVMLKEKLAEQ